MIPKFDQQIGYIQDVLEEDERENLFKLKMVNRLKEEEIER